MTGRDIINFCQFEETTPNIILHHLRRHYSILYLEISFLFISIYINICPLFKFSLDPVTYYCWLLMTNWMKPLMCSFYEIFFENKAWELSFFTLEDYTIAIRHKKLFLWCLNRHSHPLFAPSAIFPTVSQGSSTFHLVFKIIFTMIGSKISTWYIKNGGSENGLFNFRSQVAKKHSVRELCFQ